MSRIKALIQAIADRTIIEGSIEKAIDELEILFVAKDKGRKRLSNLVDFLKKEGTLPSQQRCSRASGRGVGND